MFKNPYDVEKDYKKLLEKGRVNNINERQFKELQRYAGERADAVECEKFGMMLAAVLV